MGWRDGDVSFVWVDLWTRDFGFLGVGYILAFSLRANIPGFFLLTFFWCRLCYLYFLSPAGLSSLNPPGLDTKSKRKDLYNLSLQLFLF